MKNPSLSSPRFYPLLIFNIKVREEREGFFRVPVRILKILIVYLFANYLVKFLSLSSPRFYPLAINYSLKKIWILDFRV